MWVGEISRHHDDTMVRDQIGLTSTHRATIRPSLRDVSASLRACAWLGCLRGDVRNVRGITPRSACGLACPEAGLEFSRRILLSIPNFLFGTPGGGKNLDLGPRVRTSFGYGNDTLDRERRRNIAGKLSKCRQRAKLRSSTRRTGAHRLLSRPKSILLGTIRPCRC
jgi:hypothetical protein